MQKQIYRSARGKEQKYLGNENCLLEYVTDYPELFKKHLDMWKILATIEKKLSQPGEKSSEEIEEAANACESYTRRFPVLFKRNMTRKMHVLSIILPKHIRKDGDYYEHLKLEQAGERLHNVLNQLERQYVTLSQSGTSLLYNSI